MYKVAEYKILISTTRLKIGTDRQNLILYMFLVCLYQKVISLIKTRLYVWVSNPALIINWGQNLLLH